MAIASLIIAIVSLLFGVYTYFRHDKKLKEQQHIINEYKITKLKYEITEAKKAMVRASVINVSGTCPWTGTLVIKITVKQSHIIYILHDSHMEQRGLVYHLRSS